MKKTTLLIITMILIITNIVTATNDWNLVSHGVTTNDFERIEAKNDKAMALTDSENILYYDGSTWTEIAKPSGIGTYVAHDFDKASDGFYYWLFFDVSNNTYQIYQYDFNTWTLGDFGNAGNDLRFKGAIGCIDDSSGFTGGSTDAECHLANFTGGLIPIISGTSTTTTNCEKVIADRTLYCIESANPVIVREWNGVSWVTRLNIATGVFGWLNDDHNTERVVTYRTGTSSSRLYSYNSTLGLFTNTLIQFTNNNPKELGLSNNNNIYFYNSTNNVIGELDNIYPFIIDDTHSVSGTVNHISFDRGSGDGWAVGNGGLMYLYTGTDTPPPTIDPYSVVGTHDPNPTLYGTSTTLYVITDHPDGERSTVNFTYIDPSTGLDVFSGSFSNVVSGQQVSNDFGVGTDFETDKTYLVHLNSSSLTSGDTANYEFNWTVIPSTTENVTVNTLQEFGANINVTQLLGVSTLTSNIGWSVGKLNNTLTIFSFDSTNINNIQFESVSINDTTGINTLTSVDQNNDLLFIGTNDELYIYNNSNTGEATSIIYWKTKGLGLYDYVKDVTAINYQAVWICERGLFSNEASLYNVTSDTFDHTISSNPCESIYYDETNDLVYIHEGTNGIRIVNPYNATEYDTITVTSTADQSTQDRISHFNDKIFGLTGNIKVEQYDVTDPKNVNKTNECRSDREIISLEAVNENQVIIGTESNLQLCDFNDDTTLSITGSHYIAQTLKTYTGGEIPHEIKRMNNEGKIQIAENNNYKVYEFTSEVQEQETNNPPVISEITSTGTSICKDQVIILEIIASDPDEDDLAYDYDCEGTKPFMENNYVSNDFTCVYTTTGTRNVQGFVTDGEITILDDISITVNDCDAPLEFNFKVIDGLTTNPVSGVLATVEGVSSDYTDDNGDVSFTVSVDQPYLISFSKNGYAPVSNTISPTTGRVTVILEPTTGLTVLTVKTISKNQSVITGSLVAVTNPVTGESVNGITDAEGQVTFVDMFTGNKLIVSATNNEGGYEFVSTYTSLTEQQQKTVTLTMTEELGEGIFLSSGRKCSDTIPNVWLCGNLTINNTGNLCDENSDCISGRCSYDGTCSKFNWTICTEQDLGMTQACMWKATAYGFFDTTLGVLLKYFLFAIVFIGLVMMIIIIVRPKK